MVNITCAAKAAVSAYGALIAIGGNYSVPLPKLAVDVSSFFLPNYTSFSLGKINALQNKSSIAQNFVAQYTEMRDQGPGTVIKVEKSRVEAVSDQSALCWLTYRIQPQNTDKAPWSWTNVYGFRLVKGGLENGQAGGWEFAIGDREHEQYEKRYPEAS
ncbi:hypothetical protein BGZ63DRAFT_440152 [Mariannaea sp. PMI_226]|nr:hypothetical protein BGZ63DRAFT_440152 [Mariannaea sp. PMI_226]